MNTRRFVASIVGLGALVALPALAQPDPDDFRCNGHCPTLFSANDMGNKQFTSSGGLGACTAAVEIGPHTGILTGTAGDDVIYNDVGDAIVYGNGGNDRICGENGVERVIAGAGDDWISTGGGVDVIFAGGGTNTINPGAGNDHVFAEGGADTVTPEGEQGGIDLICLGNGANTVNEGQGDDKIVTGTGNDTLNGGNNNDIAMYSGTGTDSLVGGTGNDRLVAGSSTATLNGTSGTDECHAPAGATFSNCDTSDNTITSAICIGKQVLGDPAGAVWNFNLTCTDGTDEDFTIAAGGGVNIFPLPLLNLFDEDCTITETTQASHPTVSVSCTRTDRAAGGGAVTYGQDATTAWADIESIDGDTVTCLFTNDVTEPTDLCENVICEDQDASDCSVPVCNPANGQCDLTEPAAVETVCRGSAGDCDLAEVCDGASESCPSDGFLPDTTVCRTGNGTVCDPDELCTGDSATCPNDVIAIDGTICLDQPECTNDDVCASGACMPQGFSTPGTSCGDAPAGSCDAQDTCDGAGTCDANVQPIDTECRAQDGVCDVAEVCDGASTDCPADAVEPDTTECRGSAGVCDVVENCDGTSKTCPDDGFVTGGTECRSAAGVCDVAELCTGVGADCPADAVEPSTTECRADDGECDVPENCDGSGVDCPADGFEPDTTECGSDSDTECTNPDTCAGDSNTCLDNHEDDGTSCGDGTETECDEADSCAAGECEANYVAQGEPCGEDADTTCTDPDSCDGEGACEPNHQPCGLVTGAGSCLFDLVPRKGVCVGGDEDGEHCDLDDDSEGDACTVGGGSCEQAREFRLIETPDVQLWPAYKLNGSNPGQFRYNVFVTGDEGAEQTTTIALPYPFVTQGANPVHVYDGSLSLVDENCMNPVGDSIAVVGATVTTEDYVNGTVDPSRHNLVCDEYDGPLTGPDSGARCMFDVTYTVPASGLVHIRVHMDYGIKHPIHQDGNPADGFSDRYDLGALDETFGGWDALFETAGNDGPVRIANCQKYDFEHFDGITSLGGDTVSSVNEFKRIAGVMGLLTKSSDGSGQTGLRVELIKAGKVVSAGTTDADGFYYLPYKHKGKAQLFTVRVVGSSLGQSITLKANGWAEVNFDLTTGTATGQFGTGRR